MWWWERLGAGALVGATALRGDAPLEGDVLAFYEAAFTTCALASGIVVGRLRSAESASRLRARHLTRRTIQSESHVRRRVADAIHDGPVQELIGLDMILSSARKAAADGRGGTAAALIDEARELTERNIRALRDEIVDLGPYAFQELGFDVAIENCMQVWERRYGFEVGLSIERIELPAGGGRRSVPHRSGGGGERRPPRGGDGGLDLAAHGQLGCRAARDRQRPRLRAREPAGGSRARTHRARVHA